MEERIEKHREFLVDRIDPGFGLLDKLLASGALRREAFQEIKLNNNTACKKSRILLDFILNNKKANELVSALMDSGQTHLVNYLNTDGGYGLAFGDDWPLSENDLRRLDINRESLMDLLDTTELCIRLFSEKVINDRQKQFISSKPTNYEKNEALLDILSKFSLRQYKKTIVCLNDSNQSHIANLLSDGGVLVRVHANIEVLDGNANELEDEIITQFRRVLESRPLDEAIQLLEQTKMGIIAAKKGHSIVLYIHCKTHDELLQLIDLLKTDTLKETVKRIFIELLSIRDDLRISLTWSSEEFERTSTYFDSGEVFLSGDLQSRLEVTERSYISTSASAEDSRDEGWTRDSSNRPTESGKIHVCGCDASTQTDEEPYEERKSARSDDYLSLSRKLQEAQRENDKLKKLLAHQSNIAASKYKSDPTLVRTIRTKTSEAKQTWVRGLTILDKELFVVSQGLSEVQVYDSMEFNFSRQWNLKELMNPYDLGSCSRLKCLYILDFKGSSHSSEILRVDSNGKLIKKWPIGDDNGWAISVTDESNVILTVTDNSKLKEYSPDGELIREILLSPYSGRPIRHPCHAVKLATGHFVVSHGYYGDDLHRVCLMDPGGNCKKLFGGKCGSGNERMNLPIHLAVDENGFVMLVDLWNSRVLLLDSNLKFERVILSKARNPELRFPWRILLDESNGRLLVADNERNEGRILIFQFK